MDLALAKSIVDQLADAGVDSITWTGGGEPTLHPHFAEIIEYADGKVAQGVYTHGGHIVDKDLARLLKRTMTFVYVSMDAATPEAYKRDKGVNRFDKVCDGIRALRAADGDATVGVGYLVTADNWMQAGVAVEVVGSLGADYIQFRPTINYEQDNPNELCEDTSWMDAALGYIQTLTGGLPIEIDARRFRGYQDWESHPYPTCWWSALQSVITPSGAMWTCVNKREHPAALVGELAKESFADIWARRQVAQVDGDCRVMCRGHVANLALNDIFAEKPHAAFV